MNEYIEEGYKLMTQYITEKRIKTKNRKFLRRLDKFYNKYMEKEGVLTVEEEKEYLELEREFFNNILPVSDKPEDQASLEVLKILTQTPIIENDEDKE